MPKPNRTLCALLGLAVLAPTLLHAQGSLTPPADTPAPSMHSLEQIYHRLAAVETAQSALAAEQHAATTLLAAANTDRLRWRTTVVARTEGTTIGEHCSLAFDADGQPAIAALRGLHQLVLFRSTSTGWAADIVDGHAYTGRSASLAFDRSGRACVAFLRANDADLMFAMRYSGGWDIRTIDTEASSQDHTVALALDPAGNPAIAYQKFVDTNFQHKVAVVRSPAEGNWGTPAVYDPGRQLGLAVDLAFEANRTPIAVFHNASQHTLMWGRPGNTSAWSSTGTIDTGVGPHLSVALAPNGQPAVAYYDTTNKRLKFARRNGTTWTTMVVDETADTDVGTRCSLAFGPDGQPAIAYYDATNCNVKFARANAQTWNSWTISTPAATGDVGTYLDLAFGPDGLPAIAYYDATNKALKLVRRVLSSE